MFTEHERDYFESMLKAQFNEVHSKLDHIHAEVKRTNGRVTKLEDEIVEVKLNIENAKGHAKGINRMIMIFLTVLGIVIGAWATMMWH